MITKDLDKVREIFLDPALDKETLDDNKLKLQEWESALSSSEMALSWREHDFTKEVFKQCVVAYKNMAMSLAENRNLTEKERITLWAKQDACIFILTLVEKDPKATIVGIESDIRKALNATYNGRVATVGALVLLINIYQMVKKDIVAKLTELNVKFDSKAKADELYALLPEDVRAEIEAKEAADAEAAAKTSNATEVTVNYIGGTRVFSQEIHGDDFLKVAAEFCETHADKEAKIVDPA